ncbi:MAG: hypothetical protein M3O71_02490 [Bacteroidota bacterium]|nr:hypothetical protein [Bacteroidota bacterium]
MKTKKFIGEIMSIPEAIKKNQYTTLQMIVCTAALMTIIFCGLLIINPTHLKN